MEMVLVFTITRGTSMVIEWIITVHTFARWEKIMNKLGNKSVGEARRADSAGVRFPINHMKYGWGPPSDLLKNVILKRGTLNHTA